MRYFLLLFAHVCIHHLFQSLLADCDGGGWRIFSSQAYSVRGPSSPFSRTSSFSSVSASSFAINCIMPFVPTGLSGLYFPFARTSFPKKMYASGPFAVRIKFNALFYLLHNPLEEVDMWPSLDRSGLYRPDTVSGTFPSPTQVLPSTVWTVSS